MILRMAGYWACRCICRLSSLRFSIVQMSVPSGLCSVLCDGFVGCWVSSYLLYMLDGCIDLG